MISFHQRHCKFLYLNLTGTSPALLSLLEDVLGYYKLNYSRSVVASPHNLGARACLILGCPNRISHQLQIHV